MEKYSYYLSSFNIEINISNYVVFSNKILSVNKL